MWTNYLSFFMLYLGTLFNILIWYSSSNVSVRMIALVWQFIIYMQFMDTFSHMTISYRSYVTYGTFTFNVLQPIVVALLFAFISTSDIVRYTLFALAGTYLVSLLYQYNAIHLNEPNPSTDLYWWKDVGQMSLPLYMLIFTVALLTMKPLWMGVCQLAYMFTALSLSYFSVHEEVLAWFIACGPIFTYLVLAYKPIPN